MKKKDKTKETKMGCQKRKFNHQTPILYSLYSIKISSYELRLGRFLCASAADSDLHRLADGSPWHKSGSQRRAGGTKWRADGS